MTKSNRAQALLRKAETPATGPAMERRRAAAAPEPESAPVDVTHLRRKSDPVRRESEPYLGYFLISEGWSMTAIAMGIAVMMLWLNQFRMPQPMVLGLLGAAVAALMLVPVLNLVAPLVGVAAGTHLVLRRIGRQR